MEGRNGDEKANGDEASVAAMSSAPRLSVLTLLPLLTDCSSSSCRCFFVRRSFLTVDGAVEVVAAAAAAAAAAVALALLLALRFLPPAGFCADAGDDELRSLRPPADLDRFLPLTRTSTSDDVRAIGGDPARPAESRDANDGSADDEYELDEEDTGDEGVEREDDETGVVDDPNRNDESVLPRACVSASSAAVVFESASSLRRL
jgi:hypothetical protein